MLVRTGSFYDWFEIGADESRNARRLAQEAAARAEGMTDVEDYLALGAVCLHSRPRCIFEIGTYLGVTADFFLKILPECTVVSIAYTNAGLLRRKFNNSDLPKSCVGRCVDSPGADRFHQLFGNSHKLKAESLIAQFGYFDLVFVDGDHSVDGVRQDTELAQRILKPDGCICWHDANPKEKYRGVRSYLEETLPLVAIATSDSYIGGVACWSQEIEKELMTQQSGQTQETSEAGEITVV